MRLRTLPQACNGTLLIAMLAALPATQCSEKPPPPPPRTECGLFAADCLPLAGSEPLALAVEYLDADQDLDLVSLNFFSHDVSVLLNDGNTSFPEETAYGVLNGPHSIQTADLDGDGDADLVAQAVEGATVLFNRGDGTFDRIDLRNAWSSAGTAADLDNDGDVDLALARELLTPTTVSILLNDGGGTFGPGPVVEFSDDTLNLRHIIAADVNNDGRTDLVTAAWTAGRVFILLNQGSALFEVSAELAACERYVYGELAVADLDGRDGPDLLFAYHGIAGVDPEGVIVFLNGGDGTFGTGRELQAGSGPDALDATDFDADGDVDLAVANYVSDDLSILLNAGDATFALAETIALDADDGPTDIRAADLDGDGDPDLAVANFKSDSIGLFLNDGHGSFIRQD